MQLLVKNKVVANGEGYMYVRHDAGRSVYAKKGAGGESRGSTCYAPQGDRTAGARTNCIAVSNSFRRESAALKSSQ